MNEKTMTLWTRDWRVSSKAEIEAFCIGGSHFSYTDNKSPGRPITDALADGWKLLAPPIKQKGYWVWWFSREEK